MDLRIKGKNALVTGTGKGIGYEIARVLAAEGAHVAAVSRNRDSLVDLMRDIGGQASGHYMIAQDLMEEGTPAAVISELEKSFGKLDILVNNLGTTLDISDPFCSLEDWRRVYRVNLEVGIEFNNLVIPHMREQRFGRIVNIGSTASFENNGPVTYCAMKAAFAAYSRSMGRVLAKDGVVMTAVLPGAVYTEGGFWETAMKERPEHVKKYLEDRCPAGKFGKTEDIANVVAFLCSELAEFCQGSIVPVDGGQSRHYFLQ